MFPLDDRRVERFNPDPAGRPQLIKGNRQLLFGGMGRLTENSVVNLKNKSHAVTAQVVVPDSGAQGVLIAQGGAFGGWSLHATGGRPAYRYNLFGLQRFKVTGDRQIPAGEHQVRAEFAYDGGGLAKGGTVTLFIDGEKVAEGRARATVPMLFSPDETTDVGSDGGTPVSDDYGPKTAPSPGGCAGSRSTWATTPKTWTISSRRRSGCGSPWPVSKRLWMSTQADPPEQPAQGTSGAGRPLPAIARYWWLTALRGLVALASRWPSRWAAATPAG